MEGKKSKEQREAVVKLEQGIHLVKTLWVLARDQTRTLPKIKVKVSQSQAGESGHEFKNNGTNFHVKLAIRKELLQNISVFEDLVQVQAYLRWERKDKQMYSPEQQKEEHESARFELLEEVVRGTSIEDLRANLTRKSDGHETKGPSIHEMKNKIAEELVQIQSYIRWEKAGKPNYSTDQQLVNVHVR